MHVRPAVHGDINQFIELGREMHAESIFHVYDFDEAKLRSYIEMLIDQDWGIALALVDGNKTVGGFLGVIVEHWFGKDKWASDVALFVAAEHRSGRAGLQLLHAYVDEAKRSGANQVVMANSTGYEPDRVARLFGKAGLKQVGYVMSMHVPKEDQ